MAPLEGARTLQLGGLVLLGAALLGLAALGLDWRYAPSALRYPLVEWGLAAVGLVLLVSAISLASWKPRGWVQPPAPAEEVAPARPSMMTLPALLGEETSPPPLPARPTPSAEGSPIPPVTVTGRPVGVGAQETSSSTLLIPFAERPDVPALPFEPGEPGQSVSRLVDRIDAMQRVSPPAPPTPAPSAPSAEPSVASALLLRLTRIPTPPSATVPVDAARRCNDCGAALGSPPQFDACGDCGRALCARCYWRTSSGPQAHLCLSCARDRSVPRPGVPAPTFGRPTPAVAVATPTARVLQPRRPVS